MASFITVPELKAYPLPITSQQWSKIGDDQLAIVIGYASEHLEDYMDRKMEVSNFVDRLKGSGLHKQMLTRYPLVTLNAVTAYSGSNAATTYSVASFWEDNEAGILEWLDKNRYKFYNTMTWIFDYDAGYSTIPGPVKHACALQTTKMLQPVFRGGAQFTETEFINELDEQIVELLEPYRRRTTK